ncbi:MAG: hypothetical protein ACI9G1_003226 [Pirellulaceae bacterium]|jgi:hypothetical protein
MSAKIWAKAIPQLTRKMGNIDLMQIVPLLTVILLLTTAPDIWYLRTPLLVLCIAGLAYQELLKKTQFWYIVAALIGATIYLNWESSDNHKYMLCYWCLALCAVFSLPVKVQEEAMHRTSRLLLGLSMAFAVAWKVGTFEYMNGAFFQHTLLLDGRFDYFARWFAGVSSTTLGDNRELRDLLVAGYLRDITVNNVQLGGGSAVALLAQITTWWTLLIELAFAVLFLLPNNRWTATSRNSVLLLFAVTTYAFATVRGFGWMLMMLGLAQCSKKESGFRFSYIAVFVLIQIYTLPIQPLIQRVSNSFSTPACCADTDVRSKTPNAGGDNAGGDNAKINNTDLQVATATE